MRIVDRKEVGAALEAFCDKFETYKEAARKLGITLSQLSAARNKPKSVVPAKALKKLGFEFKAVYLAKDLPPTRLQKVVKSLSKKPPAASLKKPAPPPKKAKVTMAEALREAREEQNPSVPEPPVTPPADSPDMADLRDNLYADNEPENPDIYIPDDNGDNITIN